MSTHAMVFAACLLMAPSAVWGQGLIASPNPVTIKVALGAGTGLDGLGGCGSLSDKINCQQRRWNHFLSWRI
jgi:hypothetical protein